MAVATGYTEYGVYLWFLNDKLSPRAVRALMSVSRALNPKKPPLTEADLLPFLLA